MAQAPDSYPVYVRGRLDSPSRALWLIKWLLVIPHLIVLFFLSIASFVATVLAFFAILFTKRYPRGLFNFNVGVLRWYWRVSYYSFNAGATDKYPPFSLQPDDNYPADLSVEYPEELSRWLPLVKWLLLVPHGIILGVLTDWLIPGLALLAVVALLFTGRYPRGIFDFVLAMNRWNIRVSAYGGLMTDKYPPFRLDQGEEG